MKLNESSFDLEDVKKMLELYSKLKDTDIFKEFYEEELEPIKIERLKMLFFLQKQNPYLLLSLRVNQILHFMLYESVLS
ncbi:hypothetical protein [Bacillus toyonensis]|uniref:DUF1878 domain-containing protein n=1 Tax=Bacillus toyonensis TaxID=155322 RepID=A0AB36T8R0_9BACI|nr:hypothetical protein [Bacillus toyonensis]PEC09867.1 hypothetical protein CON55_15940 [Bacillus toyonensis]PEN90177.1 hypothetical protein CN551_07560 [Bacillus toyonensis]